MAQKITKNTRSTFENICDKLIQKFGNPLYAKFTCTKFKKESDTFMWVANAHNEIGVQPVHYELRLDKNESGEPKLFVEVHFESESNLSTPIKMLNQAIENDVKKGSLISVYHPQNANDFAYYWYREPDVEFPVDDSDKNIDDIYNAFEELDNLVGDKIRDVIENMM